MSIFGGIDVGLHRSFPCVIDTERRELAGVMVHPPQCRR